MSQDPTDAELIAYLDEMLAAERATEVERLLRDQPELRQRTALLSRRRDQGGHSVGEIWRRRRLSCLSREQLGLFLLDVLDPGLAEYIQFHVTVVGCRVCEANLQDLRALQQENGSDRRRQRYFESSAGLLRSRRDSD